MSEFPCISNMIDILEELQVRSNSDRARAKDKLLDRLKSLRQLLPGLDVQCSRNVFKLLVERSVILDVSELNDIAFPFLFAFVTKLFGVVFHSDDSTEISRMEVIEEAHRVLGGQIDRRTSDLKEGTASGMLRDLRKSKRCGVVVTQLPPDVTDSVLGNLGTVFSMRLGDSHCINRAAACLNLAPWQKPELAKLPDRQAIARFSRYGNPVQIVIKDAGELLSGSRPVSRDDARQRSKPTLDAIPYLRRAETGDPGAESERNDPATPEGGLPPDERRVFARIVRIPWERTQDRMDALGLDRDTDGRLRTKLRARGLVGPGGKVGAKYRLTAPTARGRQLAEEMGLSMGKPGKGSLVHEAIVYHAEQSLGRRSSAFRFQRVGVSSTLTGVQPDTLLIFSDGGRVPVQACYRNQPRSEANVLLKLHRLSGLEPSHPERVEFVMAVAVNKRHKAAVERAVKERNKGQIPGKLVILDFDSIVAPDWDWDDVLDAGI